MRAFPQRGGKVELLVKAKWRKHFPCTLIFQGLAWLTSAKVFSLATWTTHWDTLVVHWYFYWASGSPLKLNPAYKHNRTNLTGHGSWTNTSFTSYLGLIGLTSLILTLAVFSSKASSFKLSSTFVFLLSIFALIEESVKAMESLTTE